ncbi:scavenger receptor class F member 2-like [Ruditapes philippinarum]|uniref:scavenger receptor class F member 2-like n=1 Tax=Ruditapes philippinarum TaxID=129788 RepID=UPI00295BDD7C|nr:scavenger receptor class F member 2-like [Ruditapes philippinarum]
MCQDACGQGCYYTTCRKTDGYCSTCKSRFWGDVCNKTCSKNCLSCKKVTGVCIECNAGLWRPSCRQECDQSCSTSECFIESGECKKCHLNKWGKFCENLCSTSCSWGCHRQTGHCLSCRNRYWGQDCSNMCNNSRCEQCSITNGLCTLCQHRFWGENCQNTCKSDKCLQCYMDTGYCSACPQGRWGLLCQNTCRDECLCCNIRTGSCTLPCPDVSDAGKLAQDDIQAVGIIVVMVICIAITVVAFGLNGVIRYILRRRKSRKEHDRAKGLKAATEMGNDPSTSTKTRDPMYINVTESNLSELPSTESGLSELPSDHVYERLRH